MRQNAVHKYNHPTKAIRLICMDGLTKPLFLGRLRHERLTSNQMVSLCFLDIDVETLYDEHYNISQVGLLFLQTYVK